MASLIENLSLSNFFTYYPPLGASGCRGVQGRCRGMQWDAIGMQGDAGCIPLHPAGGGKPAAAKPPESKADSSKPRQTIADQGRQWQTKAF